MKIPHVFKHKSCIQCKKDLGCAFLLLVVQENMLAYLQSGIITAILKSHKDLIYNAYFLKTATLKKLLERKQLTQVGHSSSLNTDWICGSLSYSSLASLG